MSDGRNRWRLESITIRDMLAFQGEYRREFEPGLQVISASNHTGKTSITMATLWCITGQIPALARLNKSSFRLDNRHVGSNAEPEARLVMTDGNQSMVINRSYRPRPNLDEDLTVEIGDASYTGADAQEQLFETLGVKTRSIEGCGVVLQDSHLALITGKETDRNQVISDMLGLYNLSRLVPVLVDQSKEVKSFHEEVSQYLDHADPLKKWEERDDQLASELSDLENQAVDAGLTAEGVLEDPDITGHDMIVSVADDLGLKDVPERSTIEEGVVWIRQALGKLRTSSPEATEAAKVDREKRKQGGALSSLKDFRDRFSNLHDDLAVESQGGEMDIEALLAQVTSGDRTLAANNNTRGELGKEKELFTVAYSHLLSCPDGEKCPLCETAIDLTKLTLNMKSRIEVSVAEELEQLDRDDELARNKKRDAEERVETLRALKRTLKDLVDDLVEDLDGLAPALVARLDVGLLFADVQARTDVAGELETVIANQENTVEKLGSKLEECLERRNLVEEDRYQPAEKSINLVNDRLAPLSEKHAKIKQHGELRDAAVARNTDLGKVNKKAKALTNRLKKIARALAEHEESSATETFNAQLPRISELFNSISGNPDYDGLAVKTSVKLNSVAYKLIASCSDFGNLDEAVGHVLSGGDFSAAAMALLIGLASGEDHRLGFIMLDDPAQGMDPVLQASFAEALGGLDTDRQTIILTHQPEFAEALNKAGAHHSTLGQWQGGRLH